MINPEKIKQARELKRLTQHQLAERLGIDRSAVGQMEIGLYDATPYLQAIAFATGFPPAFFEDTQTEEFPIGSLQFRARSSLIRRVDKAEAYRLGQTVFQVYRRLAARLKLAEPRAPRLDNAAPRRAAELVRSLMDLSPDAPIKNLVNAVEHLGVVVLGIPRVLPHRDAFSVWSGETPIIVLSASLPGDRVRFSVAHELGHLVLHQALRGTVPVIENAADEFASELLLPHETIFEELLDGPTFSRFAELKPRWGVSIQTLARKARSVKLITERQYHAVFEQLAKLGYGRKNEPVAIPIEKPRALRQMAERIYGVPIDYGRFTLDVKLTTPFLIEIVNAHAEGRTTSPTKGGGSVVKIRG